MTEDERSHTEASNAISYSSSEVDLERQNEVDLERQKEVDLSANFKRPKNREDSSDFDDSWTV